MTPTPPGHEAPFSLIFPLDTFYEAAQRPLPHIEQIAGPEMPEPYRSLLVGEHDMTPTLEAFHGDKLGISLLEHTVEGACYSRLVILTLPDGRPVEFGAIVIYLECLPEHGRECVLQGRKPLGTVLAEDGIAHSSCPRAFVRVKPDALMNQALHLSDDRPLYGRRNVLLTADHRVLADILEILPPAESGD
jgi:chorismate-pyruvate lyase